MYISEALNTYQWFCLNILRDTEILRLKSFKTRKFSLIPVTKQEKTWGFIPDASGQLQM